MTISLTDDLPTESKAGIEERLAEMAPSLSNPKLNLSKCPVEVPGQNYAVVSFVGPDCSQKSTKAGFRVLGCFKTAEDANAHARIIMETESLFNIYVCDMYNWCLCTPPEGEIPRETCDKELNSLITHHRETQEKSRLMNEERKRLLIEQEGVRQKTIKEENALLKESDKETL